MKSRRHPAGMLIAAAAAALVAVSCGSRTGLFGGLPGAPGDAGLEADVETDAPEEAEASVDATVDGPMPECTPRTCAGQGFQCGDNGDGCGHVIHCGPCPVPQICGVGGYSRCGGGWGLGPDGGPICNPTTCAALGANCGVAGNGCGGTLQCGTCQAPLICGAQAPYRCGSACFGLCQQQVQCDSGTTTVSGTVVAGTLPQFGAPDPIYDALVYVPNKKVEPFQQGVTCTQCGGDVSGDPLVQTQSAADGTFTVQNMPVGTNIPLVIQLGRWRRQVTIPQVLPCQDNPLPQDLTRMPRNQKEGDIPLTAIATGSADTIECVLMKMGVDQSEFTTPSQGGRVQIYEGSASDSSGTYLGANAGPGTPTAPTLWDSPSAWALYDQVLLPCEARESPQTATEQQNLINYTSAGGRVYITHYGYTWFQGAPPFSGTAQWTGQQPGNPPASETGFVDTSSMDGQVFATWLGNVGALSGGNQMTIQAPRNNVSAVIPPTEQLMYGVEATQHTLLLSFLTPIGQSMQCGRVLYGDFHVADVPTPTPGTSITFPAECDMVPMSAQEKALEFELYDIAQCVPAPPPPCEPLSCAQQGFNCGAQGDGCGNQINCGKCTGEDTCGGGGVPGVCGYPDAGTCVPKTCAQLGANCGGVGDGCGHAITCGTCTPPAICGGGGQPNVCGT